MALAMFIHQSQLPHILEPRLYHCPQQFEREVELLFNPSWQCIGTTADALEHNTFFTASRFGKPLLVRNEQGIYHTFLNVCPHRHTVLTSVCAGESERIKCQYHGWEFSIDGKSAKIPDARSFRPMPGGPECLQKFPTEVRGPLIFVALGDSSSRSDWDSGLLEEACNEFPAERWQRWETWSYDFDVNWKIVVENTVESYHVESVHPTTLFQAATEDEMEHEIQSQGTIMRSNVTSPRLYNRLADFVLPRLDPKCNHRYRLYHVFPNLFLIRIDAMLQVMNVLPTSAESCKLRVDLFILRASPETWLTRQLTKNWGRLKSWIIKKILAEDAAIYPAIHQGMKVSPFHGNISTREELVWGFQKYVADRCQISLGGQQS